MATYTPVDKSVPSSERTTIITSVEAGDQINLFDVLGREARGLIVTASNDTDVVEYRLNNRREIRKPLVKEYSLNLATRAWGIHPDDFELVEYWDHSTPTFSTTGSAFELQTELQISSIEIVSLTGPSSVSIVVW